jgi:L-asparagine transporter-like permease
MKKPGYLGGRRRTPLEVGITVLAVIVLVTAVILAVTHVTGSSVLAIVSGPVFILILLRYWVETKQAKRNADDHHG